MIAALFVEKEGVYSNLPDVDPWPVIAHPPYERWGRYWHGGPSAKERKVKGADGGCFAAALAAVRRFSGVLEHPEGSAAWRAFGLFTPPKGGGWIVADDRGGWTCCIEQGHYGHRARKATWLYAVGVPLPSLRWGRSTWTKRLDLGFHTAEERRAFLRPPPGFDRRAERRAFLAEYAAKMGKELCCPERMGKKERAATPPAFRDLLLSIVRGGARE